MPLKDYEKWRGAGAPETYQPRNPTAFNNMRTAANNAFTGRTDMSGISKAATTLKSKLPSIWDRVKVEMNNIRNSQFGRDVGGVVENVIARPQRWLAGQVNRGVENMGRYYSDPVMEGVGRTGRKYWEGNNSNPTWEPPLNTAPIPSGQSIREKMGTAPVSNPLERPAERSTGGTTEFAPKPVATSNYESAGNKNVNRYLEIARAGAGDIDKKFEEMGGVEVIRGGQNKSQTYWDPRTGKEYASKQEAVQGRPGLLTSQEMLNTEQQTLDRQQKAGTESMKDATTRYVADLQAKLTREGYKGQSANRFEYIGPEMNLDGKPMTEAVIFDKASGTVKPASALNPKDIAGDMAENFEKDPAQMAYQIIMLPQDMRGQVFGYLPKQYQQWILDNESQINKNSVKFQAGRY